MPGAVRSLQLISRAVKSTGLLGKIFMDALSEQVRRHYTTPAFPKTLQGTVRYKKVVSSGPFHF